MTSADISHLEPWILPLPHYHQSWFKSAFRAIIGAGYVPRDLGPNDIEDGNALVWQKGDTYIFASRFFQFHQTGDLAGVTLIDEGESYEIQLSVNTPLEVVFSALTHLNPDEE